MSQRIVTFSVDDIAVDPDGVMASLNDACCHRHDHYRIHGMCQVATEVFYVLLPLAAHEKARTYVMVPVDDISYDGFVSLLNERWSGGFDIIGTIQVYDTTYALFERQPS